MAIVLRSSKSVPLTHVELDGNFTDLNTRTNLIEANYVKTINGLTATSNAVTITTNNITENTNLYYTDTRSRAAISVTDAGGDGSLSYNSSTGVITYTGPSASEVRSHFTAGSGIGIASGEISVLLDGINDTHIDFGTGANQVDTDVVPEGSANLYFTNARADARIAAASVDDLSDVDLSLQVNGFGLVWNSSTMRLELAELPGAAGGEANQAANLGGYNEIFAGKAGVTFNFRTINHDDNITITQNANDLTIGLVSSPEFGNIKINSAANTIENTSTNSDIILKPNGTGSVLIDGKLEPNADSSYTLGASGNEWSQAYIDTVTATNVAGTLTTASQTNVTSVGTLNGLTIAGSQTIQMGTNRVQGVTDPVSAQDAATKNYVDGLLSSGTTIFTLQADSGSNDTVETGDTIDFEGTANEIQTTVTANKITIGLPNDVTISNNLTVDGNFTVNGTTTTINATTIDVTDPLIKLARDNESSDSVDIGFFGHYYDNGPAHAGLFRDASDNKFKMFTGYGVAGDVGGATTIDTSDAGFRLATLQLEALEIGNTDNPSLHIRGSAISTVNTNQSISITTAGSGIVDIDADVQLRAQSDLRFADADSSNWVAFQAPTTVASNVTWTLPSADAGVSGYALVSNGAGTLSFAAAGATVSNDEATATNFLLYFSDTTTGALTTVKQDSGLTYNPSTGTLTAATFSGALSGNATTATTATNATNITVADESADTTCNVVFVTGTTGNLPPKTGTNLTFNSANGTLTATTFSGALSGNATTATTATTATNVTTTDNTATNETVYIAFVDGTSGGQGIEVDSTGLTYNPSTNTLTTSFFSGTATQAQYADLAEMYIPDAGYPVGTVLKVGGSFEVTHCDSLGVPAGVVSENPAYLMNSEQEGGIPVALVGRVKVRVIGPVEKGQVVKADNNGVASTTADGDRVGIALETNTDAGEKLVECMLKV